MDQEPVMITGQSGPELEGRLARPRGQVKGGALILHPHPLYGGDMHNQVTAALAQAAHDTGWAALRFNFRGVGRSGGEHGHGAGEVEDVYAAAAWLTTQTGHRLVLLGYSFGALVGSNAAPSLARLAGGIWVSPPLILGRLAPWPDTGGPLLILAGDRDEFTEIESLRAYQKQNSARSRLVWQKGGDHFWSMGLSALINHSQAFLQDIG